MTESALDVRALLVETAAGLFEATTPLMGRSSEGEIELGRRVWRDVEQADLAKVGIPESAGGAGGSLADACAVLRTAARWVPPIALAETQLASWLLAGAGLDIPAGQLAVAPNTLAGLPQLGTSTLPAVPFAGAVKHLAVLAEQEGSPVVALFDLDSISRRPAPSYAPDAWASVDLGGATPLAVGPAGGSLDELLARGALFRAQQVAGALGRVLELAVAYSGEREQFGRPINRFQAIQHHLADIAAETVAAGMAAEAAAELAESGELERAAALAKSRTGLAVRAAAVAHQVHGAIGVTEEHPLHLFTRRIWDWRDDFGSDVEWSGRLGRLVLSAGAEAFWPEVSRIL